MYRHKCRLSIKDKNIIVFKLDRQKNQFETWLQQSWVELWRSRTIEKEPLISNVIIFVDAQTKCEPCWATFSLLRFPMLLDNGYVQILWLYLYAALKTLHLDPVPGKLYLYWRSSNIWIQDLLLNFNLWSGFMTNIRNHLLRIRNSDGDTGKWGQEIFACPATISAV